MKMRIVLSTVVLLACSNQAVTAQVFDIDAYLAIKDVSEISISPDGAFVAYTVTGNDLAKDKSQSAVWMQPTAGGPPVRMTALESSASTPKWSPDNRYLAVLSDRKDETTQVWLLGRRGGDAQQLTALRQGVGDYEWSPEGARLLLLVQDPAPADLDDVERPNPRPYVIDRLEFKGDYVGYLDDRRTHIHIIEIGDCETRQVTFGDYDDSEPAWSPDGKHIIFVSNRTEMPERNRNTDLWRISIGSNDPRPERLTNADIADAAPAWSPDGKLIAYTSAVSDGLPIYAIPQLAILNLETGKSRLVPSLAEVQVFAHRFSDDGRSIFAITEYRGEQQLVRVDVTSGAIERLVARENVVNEFKVSPDGRIFLVMSLPQHPAEIFSFNGKELQRFSAVNRDLMTGIRTGVVEKHKFKVADGTEIDTFVVFPPGFEKGRRYPAVLHIHGGPWAQWSGAFDFESQLLAARGYVVIMPNPRGSFGYGQRFTDALTKDWGGIDFGDVMAAVDFAIGQGWVDERRLAVYGWSYGGYLTNRIITKTDRFKAAISGASETLVVANYGHDEWQRLWEEEFGLPWLDENREAWERISPFYDLDKVTTPTLIVGGEDDWNMPILNSEQLYIVLKRRGVPTRLIVYPGEGHGISVPSYQKDLYERYFDWLGRYLGE